MVEQLVNYENCKINALAQMTEFVNNSSIPNKEEAIEENKQMLQNEEEPTIVLGGEFEQYVLTYDEFSNNIFVEDENDDTFSFGIEIQDLDLDDYYTYVDIADELNDQIEEYFEDEIIEDCGEYWELKSKIDMKKNLNADAATAQTTASAINEANKICEMFIEYFNRDLAFCCSTWNEVLEQQIDCLSEETWEDLFEQYDDFVYDYCYKFYETNKIWFI